MSGPSYAFPQLLTHIDTTADVADLTFGVNSGTNKRVRNRRRLSLPKRSIDSIVEYVKDVVTDCRQAYEQDAEEEDKMWEKEMHSISEDSIVQCTRFTDCLRLRPYENILHLVPRQVNVVTLAEATPIPGFGTTLPLDLHRIVYRCNAVYFAPERFAAVQIAFADPTCRILLFHTGRLVGTGCSDVASARLALIKAKRLLAKEACVYVSINKFRVINVVGAVTLGVQVNCDSFANAHQATSHLDSSSFVGLTWRPKDIRGCCEIYSSGKANIPGSRSQRELLDSFYRMLPELLRFSTASHLLVHFPSETSKVVDTKESNDVREAAAQKNSTVPMTENDDL